jgi:hypothetical protein
MTTRSVKAAEAAVVKLYVDVRILHASLVLSEPIVNERQIRLAHRIVKQCARLAALRAKKARAP